MRRILFLIILAILFIPKNSFADFKNIKKKAKIINPEVIFPVPKKKSNCQTKMYVNPETNFVTPVLKVEAPSLLDTGKFSPLAPVGVLNLSF